MVEMSKASPPGGGDTLSVLLIEHRGADARLGVQALQSHPDYRFHVTVQRGLAAGLETLRESLPDAVVLDVDLPGGGLTVVEEIRAAAPTLPLIVLAGNDTGKDGIRAMNAGAQDYLIKGQLDHSALGRVVIQAIVRQRLRMELAKRLREVENTHLRLRNIIDLNLDGILVLDRDGHILFANRMAKRFLIQKGGESLDRHLHHPTTDLDGTVFTLYGPDDQPRKIHMRIYPTEWDEKDAFMVLLREPLPSEAREGDSRIRQADRDPITGLFNWDAFSRHGRDFLYNAGRAGTSAALLCLNLERFRRVNQTLGHAVGDAVLRRVADRLGQQLRAGDLLSCLGGDEFLVLLTSLRQTRDASTVAGKLLDTVALPIEHEDGDLRIRGRVGISLFPRDGNNIAELIGHAQIAAERAKRWQPHRVAYYTADLTSQTTRRFQLEQKLQKALANRQFKLLYQPIVDTNTNVPAAAEALLRWQPDPDTVVSANEIIPTLEETGLIDEVGEWVIRTACTEARVWHDDGCAISVSINLSPIQFASEQLPEKIRAALADSGLPPERLWLEVTETALMQSLETSIDMLEQLRAMGVSICIDDFGTGFSSLAHLKRFPVDTLKIDRSFIRDIAGNSRDAAITRNTVQLAHALNLTVVAEGVESDGQVERLREYGCDFHQGYVYNPPLTPWELRNLIATAKDSKSVL